MNIQGSGKKLKKLKLHLPITQFCVDPVTQLSPGTIAMCAIKANFIKCNITYKSFSSYLIAILKTPRYTTQQFKLKKIF